MIHAIIERSDSRDEGTPGTFTTDGFFCATLEPPWIDNEPRRSCIPAGTYQCLLQYSNHFERDLYFVQGVPGRSGVMLHNGNFAGDITKTNPETGLPYKSHTKGCIIVGKYLRYLEKQLAVTDSKPTLARMLQYFGGEPFELEVRWLIGIPKEIPKNPIGE